MALRESVKLYPGRPAFLKDADGQDVCISAHDTWYLAERARLRTAALANHYDHGARKRDNYRTAEAFDRFKREQLDWYADFGLLPPTRTTHTPNDKRWRTRKLKHGPSGHTPAGLAAQRAARTKDAATKAWVTRVQRYGPSGCRDRSEANRRGWVLRKFAAGQHLAPGTWNRGRRKMAKRKGNPEATRRGWRTRKIRHGADGRKAPKPLPPFCPNGHDMAIHAGWTTTKRPKGSRRRKRFCRECQRAARRAWERAHPRSRSDRAEMAARRKKGAAA